MSRYASCAADTNAVGKDEYISSYVNPLVQREESRLSSTASKTRWCQLRAVTTPPISSTSGCLDSTQNINNGEYCMLGRGKPSRPAAAQRCMPQLTAIPVHRILQRLPHRYLTWQGRCSYGRWRTASQASQQSPTRLPHHNSDIPLSLLYLPASSLIHPFTTRPQSVCRPTMGYDTRVSGAQRGLNVNCIPTLSPVTEHELSRLSVTCRQLSAGASHNTGHKENPHSPGAPRGSCVDPLYMSFFLSLCLSAEAARNKSQPTPHHSGDSTVLPCTRQRAGGSNLAQLQRRGAQRSLTQHQQRRPPRLRFLRLAAPSFRLSAAWSSVDDGFPKAELCADCQLVEQLGYLPPG
ncbi:hypothetical protein C0Q70_20358 [Pomacea canaliculata]|uniref:Uncharacterized protein n=1 Tax=Pomacea canaliculata TaxID=400727 RepID=A0A2T7NFE1_POMCA|nr:hypothetical protein C0Q70_20358 [Pomacea canaliculata]